MSALPFRIPPLVLTEDLWEVPHRADPDVARLRVAPSAVPRSPSPDAKEREKAA